MIDIVDFIAAVTPTGGTKCVGALSGGVFSNYFGGSANWAAKAVDRIDTRGLDAYFALAGFGPDKKRTQRNAVALRSFWLDLDVGAGTHKYPTQKLAAAALIKFCRELNLPKPWIVNSGNGVHVYWPCDADMAPDAWTQTATLLKRACKTWGLYADPSRTTDSASVLRPVGTHNHKDPANPKPVTLLVRGAVTSQGALHLKLEQYLSANNAMPVERVENINSDLTGRGEFLPSNADKIAEQCAVMREVRDSAGNVEEPLWHAALGVLVHTVEGEAACHAWSSGHPNYSKRETDAKIARVREFGPTTCERFSDFRTGACATCPFNGKIRSPITLGTASTPQPIPEEALPAPEERPEGSHPDSFPDGYGWGIEAEKTRKSLWKMEMNHTTNEAGEDVYIPSHKTISDVLFFPSARVSQTVGNDATYSMNLVVHKEQGGFSEFTIDNGLIANPGELTEQLMKREIGVTTANRPLVNGYLNAWIAKLRKDYPNVPLVQQFGWMSDNFVVGQTLLTPDGKRKAMLTDSALHFGTHLHTHGELAPWVDTVDKIYNHPGQEALQFCILSSFAAPLWSLFGDNGGVVVYAHSAKSGYGKSTAQQVGLSAWGHYPQLLLTAGNFTINALYQHIGLMNHLPTVIDEMTKASKEFAGALVYDISTGKGKSRMTSDAVLKQTLNWSTIVSASGNTLLTEKLAMNRAEAEAEMFRVWEFTLTHRSTIDPNTALRLFGTFKENYGHAGVEFARYLVEHRSRVRTQLMKTREWFNTTMQVTQAERFWSQLHACIITALDICQKLDIIRFDRAALIDWIRHELEANRSQIRESSLDPLEQFSNMLADISTGILVTRGEGNLAVNAYAEIIRKPHGAVTGRAVMQDATRNSREKLWVSVAAARQWCDSHGTSFNEMHKALVNAGWADKNIKRLALGKGTQDYSDLVGSVKCWDINPSVIRASVGSNPIAQRVCGVIRGGVDVASSGE